MTTTTEERIVAENLHLIDEVMEQTRADRDYLADEYRSRANWALFRAARRLAGLAIGPDRERRYLAGAIHLEIRHTRIDFHRKGRRMYSLVVNSDQFDEPRSRDIPPDVMAEVREGLALGLLKPATRAWRGLGAADVARLEALISADPSPARSNGSIARDYFAATGTRIHSAAVAYYRRRLGLPPSAWSGGACPARKLA